MHNKKNVKIFFFRFFFLKQAALLLFMVFKQLHYQTVNIKRDENKLFYYVYF